MENRKQKTENGKRDMETRVYSFDVKVRAADGDEPPVIEGYPAVYNVLSDNLGGFQEKIEPGFFEDVLGIDDTRAVQNHDPNLVLGRKSAGTLFLEDTPRGLKVTIYPPETTYARDLMTVMDRGDVDQMSFKFAVKKNGSRWDHTEDGMPLRILQRGGCALLDDIAVVTYPAYPQTSAEVRAKVEEMTETDGEDGQAPDLASDEAQEAAMKQARHAARKRKIDLEKVKGK